MTLTTMLLVMAAALPQTSTVSEVSAQRVLIYDPKCDASLSPLASKVAEAALLSASKRSGLHAIGESELELLLSHEKSLADLGVCEADEACLAKLSAVVDAERVITGQLGRWGPGYVVTFNISDPVAAVVLGDESCQAGTEVELLSCTGEAIERLLGIRQGDRARFSLDLSDGDVKIAVVDLDAYDAETVLADNLTQLLALEIRKFEGTSVISRQEVAAMLDYEAKKQVLSCEDDVSCLAEIGGALGVDYLVMGGLGQLDNTYVLHLKLLNTSTADVVNRVSESFRGPEAQLPVAMRFATWSLLGRTAEGAGRVAIVVPGDAWVTIDAETFAVEGERAVDAVGAGKHVFGVQADGYYPLSYEFYVEQDRLTRLEPALVEVPRPWYKKWWPWAIIGAAVATGITVAVVASDSPDAQLDATITRGLDVAR